MAANLFLENPATGTVADYNSNISCLYMDYLRLNCEVLMIFDGSRRFLSDVLRSSSNQHT
jgi:hypothetical protein